MCESVAYCEETCSVDPHPSLTVDSEDEIFGMTRLTRVLRMKIHP